MPQEQIVPVGRPEYISARRMTTMSDKERGAAHEKLRAMWNLLLSNVSRTVPRLRSQDVLSLLGPDGRPTSVPPWDLPLDVVWGTDRPENGRAFVILAVEDADTLEKAVFVLFEQRGPTNLPLGAARMAGTVNLFGDAPVADTEDTLRALLRLYKGGASEFRRVVTADAKSATLEVTNVALQVSKKGLIPSRDKPKQDGEFLP